MALDSCHRRDKAVAAGGDCLDTASLRSPLIEYPAERRDLDGQIGVLDDRPSPDGHHDLFFQDELTGPFDEHGENIEGSRTDRYRNENTAFIAPGKPLASLIETKILEQENVGPGEQPTPPVFCAGTTPFRAEGRSRSVLNSILPRFTMNLQRFCKFFRAPL